MATSASSIPTRGRKRFLFDLRNASQTAEQGVEVQGFRILSAPLYLVLFAFIPAAAETLTLKGVVSGDEDGSFDCAIAHADGDLIASLTVLVSDASEYPSDHSFFCSSQDELPAHILRVTESIYEDGSLTIQQLLMRLLEKLARSLRTAAARRLGGNQPNSEDEDEDELEQDDDEDDVVDYELDDDVAMFGAEVGRSRVDRTVLQREFNEVVAYGFHPGFIPFGIDDFALSVSLPASLLANTIPPRALMAWDKRLLSRPQHLTLLISGLRGVYPVVQPDATYTHSAHVHGSMPQFRVGLTPKYKPTTDEAAETIRRYGLKEEYDAHPAEAVEEPLFEDLEDDDMMDLDTGDQQPEAEPQEEETLTGFQPFSLSSSLESLLNGHFLRILQLRIQYGLGWAAAETLWWEVETSQQPAGDIVRLRGQEIQSADAADTLLAQSYVLPADPLLERNGEDPINLPLLAFSYLLRRITLCPRYCLVCHQQLQEDLDALKPYVCSSKLCTYQYYNLNRGPSLEYEIRANPSIVDLLVSLAYIAAAESAGDDSPLPVGMGLRVKGRSNFSVPPGPDGLCEFDQLPANEMRTAIVQLIDSLPPIGEMKKHLEQPRVVGRAKPRLQDIDKTIPHAAWSVLRWVVGSCTAHLEELTDDDGRVKNIGPEWRQFRFSVGAPDAEARFRVAVQRAQEESVKAQQYPSLYAFHGSPAKNWHSIIRHGLWFKNIAHGRAFGNGVYFARDGAVSTGHYASGAQTCWRNSATRINNCVALAEIVNLPGKFVSTNPYFVVAQTDWIMCRYFMVKGTGSGQWAPGPAYQNPYLGFPNNNEPVQVDEVDESIPYVPLDPQYPLTLSSRAIRIPEPAHALEKILAARREEYIPVDYDGEDMNIFEAAPVVPTAPDVEDGMEVVDDWKHDRTWVEQCVEHVIPPPTESSLQATTALQRELKGILKEQKEAKSLRELGWYMPEDVIGDNLYQWIVELHSFDPTLPVAQDMARHGVNSLVFEIRFPAGFPHAPPFFRILKPRFLGFSQGGGGHVTLGGSMCMDLLTADGWLPSYSISAILIQIKLAISNLDPKPARLASNWDLPYGMQEALEGYRRAAATHGWKVPRGMDRIAR